MVNRVVQAYECKLCKQLFAVLIIVSNLSQMKMYFLKESIPKVAMLIAIKEMKFLTLSSNKDTSTRVISKLIVLMFTVSY